MTSGAFFKMQMPDLHLWAIKQYGSGVREGDSEGWPGLRMQREVAADAENAPDSGGGERDRGSLEPQMQMLPKVGTHRSSSPICPHVQHYPASSPRDQRSEWIREWWVQGGGSELGCPVWWPLATCGYWAPEMGWPKLRCAEKYKIHTRFWRHSIKK